MAYDPHRLRGYHRRACTCVRCEIVRREPPQRESPRQHTPTQAQNPEPEMVSGRPIRRFAARITPRSAFASSSRRRSLAGSVFGAVGYVISVPLWLVMVALLLLPLLFIAMGVWQSVDPDASRTGVMAEAKQKVAGGRGIDCDGVEWKREAQGRLVQGSDLLITSINRTEMPENRPKGSRTAEPGICAESRVAHKEA